MKNLAYSTQPSIRYSNELFKEDLMTLATGIVWKNRTAAINAETKDTQELYRIELFVVANRGMLNWEVIRAFPRVVILNSGLDKNLLEMYATDKKSIPEDWRQTIVDEYARALTSKNPLTGKYAYYSKATQEWVTVYEETNNYYRMLMGLPDYGASEDMYVFNTDPRWPTDIPVHEMELIDRIEMEKEGVLQKLIDANPDKDYLKYVGKKCTDFFKARIADRFEILWRDDSQTASLNHDFDDVYEKSRQLFMAVYYNEAMRQSNNLYDPFMAMAILFMTLQQMQSYYLHTDITRDFYDLESLKVLYDAYSVPFYPEIPFEYHKKIVKNINRLISYKGSSQVFFDLFQIFDLGTMNIYHYYLTKRHKVDENNKPLYRFFYDEEGNIKLDEKDRPIYDPSVYEMKFSKVLIGEDPALAIGDRSNDVDYNLLTVPDPYWIEDMDLITKLQNAKFNYLETKYIGIQTIFDLMSITFENAYIFRMITDNRDLCESMEFRWTDLGIDCSLFDLFIYLASLYCRLYGYEGLITNRIPALMDTLGYNFEQSREILRNQILSDPYLSQRQDLIDLMLDMDMETVDQANKVYDHIQTLRELIMDGYQKAKTKEEFFAYRNLYDTLMTSKEVTAVYTNPRTGELFETFTDVLANCSPDLMQRYLLTNDEDVINEMNVCIDKLEETLTSMRWLPFSAGLSSSKMIDSLFRILKFFKSAKAELIGYDITYAITLRGTNFFKMLDLIDRVFNQYWDKDKNTFMDFIELIHQLTIAKHDAFKMLDVVTRDHETVWWWDYIKYLTDCIWMIHDVIETIFSSEGWYIDFIQAVSTTTMLKSKQLMEDCTMAEEITWDILEPRYFGLIKDEIKYLVDRLRIGEHVSYCISLLYNIDFVHSMYTSFYLQKDARFKASLKYSDKVMHDEWKYHLDYDRNLFEDAYEVIRTLYTAYDIQKTDDVLEGTHFMESFDSITLKDRLARIIAAWRVDDKLISLTDLLKLVILVSKHHDMHELTDKIFQSVSMEARSDAWYIDVIEEMREFTKFVDGQFFDDHMQVETIFYELFYPHFADRLDDDIAQFVDKLKDVSAENNCKIQMMDLLYLLDDLASGKVVINLSDSGICAYAINYDGLKLKDSQGRPDSNMLFNEFLEVIDAIQNPIDDHTFSDKLIGEITGKLDDQNTLTDALTRLIASYLIDENLTLNDLMRVILSISSTKDKIRLTDTLIGKMVEYSDQDSTTLVDILNDIIFKFGQIREVHGFDDFAKAEKIFYEEIGEDLNATIKDKIFKLTDELRELPTSDRNRVRVIDTMVLVNGLSRVLAVHEENHSQLYAIIQFTDRLKDDIRNQTVYKEHDVAPTFKDIISYLDVEYSESKSAMQAFDDIWLKSESYCFSENEAKDHLINISSILRWVDDYNLDDVLRMIVALNIIKDSPATTDRLMSAIEKCQLNSSEAEPADFLKAISSIAKVSTVGVCDDHLKAEEIFFDEFEVGPTEAESIRDCIYELSDDLSSIDASAMLMREMLALVDCMGDASFSIPLVDISQSVDNLCQQTTSAKLAEATSFSDIIDAIKYSASMTDNWTMYEELAGKYQSDVSDIQSTEDLIASIIAISRYDENLDFLKDMLTILYTAATATDYHKILDDIVWHINSNLGSNHTTLDLLKTNGFRSFIDETALMEDRVTSEIIIFDSLDETQSEIIEDKIDQLVDRLRKMNGSTFFRESTVLNVLDALFAGRITVNTKTSTFTSFLSCTDTLTEDGGTSKITSKHFIKDFFDRTKELLRVHEVLQVEDCLKGITECIYNDRTKFIERLYVIAAASHYVDDEYFKELLSFCKVYSSLSETTEFADYLKETLGASVYDTSASRDMVKFVKNVASFADTSVFQEGVVSESVIFDDYDSTEIEFIEDIINRLTDKFSELSKHECNVLLEHNTMLVLDALATKQVILKDKSVIEFKDTLQQGSSESSAAEVLKLGEILFEVSKTYRAYETGIFNDLLKQTYLSHPVDSLPLNDLMMGIIAGEISDENEIVEHITEKFASTMDADRSTSEDNTIDLHIVYGDSDVGKIISQIYRIINIKNLANEHIISDVLYGKYFSEYADSKILVDRIYSIYQRYCMRDEIRLLKDMLARVKDANTIKTLQVHLDKLKATFESNHSDTAGSTDTIIQLPTEQIFTDETSDKDNFVTNILSAAAKSKLELKDRLDGVTIDKPEDFIGFLDKLIQMGCSTIERDMIHCVSALIQEDSLTTIGDMHKQLDQLYSVYSDRFGSLWIINDNMTKGHIELYTSDEFKTGDVIKDQQSRAFISEMHQFIDSLIISYHACASDIMSIEDVIKEYQVTQFGETSASADKLISVIIGKLIDNQKYLDTIIGEYVSSLEDSPYLKDQIQHCIAIANLSGDTTDYLDFFMNHQEQFKLLDTSHFDESLALKAERDFIESILTYLDNLKELYIGYGFNCIQLQDAIKIKGGESHVESNHRYVDTLNSTLSSQGSSNAGTSDDIAGTSEIRDEDYFSMAELIKPFIENFWVSMDKVSSDDALLQKRIHYVMLELGYSLDKLTSISTNYSEDTGGTSDSISSTEESLGVSSDKAQASDVLTGEYEEKYSDAAKFNSIVHYNESSTRMSPDTKVFIDAVAAKLTAFSIEDTLNLLSDTLDLKKIVLRPTDIAGTIDDLDQKTLNQSLTTYQKLSEFFGQIAETWQLANSATVSTIMDDMVNYRFQYTIKDLVDRYKDSFTVNGEMPATIRDELESFDKLYHEAARILAAFFDSASVLSMNDMNGLIQIQNSPQRIDDLTGQTEGIENESSTTHGKDDHNITDTISTTENDTGLDDGSIIEQIHLVNQKLRLISAIGKVGEVFILTGQQYYAKDLATAFETLSILESQFPDPIEEGQMLADILLGKNQIILNNPLHMKDGLYEFTPSGLRRVI